MQAMKVFALLLFLLVVACAPAAEEGPTAATADLETTAPAPPPTVTGEPAATAAIATPGPTAPPQTEATATQALPDDQRPTTNDPLPVAGRNDNGTFFFGAADAPLTLTDYSDFL